MNLHLFSGARTCDDLGICQRTGPACRKACHIATASEPPIGYEAAHSARVYYLHPVNRDEALDSPEPEWEQIGTLAASAGAAVLGVLVLLALIGLTLDGHGSAWQWLQDLGAAAMQVLG